MSQEVKFVQKKTGKVFLTLKLDTEHGSEHTAKLLKAASKFLGFPDDVIPVSTYVKDSSDEIIERLERIEKMLEENETKKPGEIIDLDKEEND